MKNILDLLFKSDYFAISDEIEIAKGRFEIPKRMIDCKKKIKRYKIWLQRK